MNLTNIFKLLFRPQSFADAELKESERQETEENASYGDKTQWRNQTLDRIAIKRRGIVIALLLVLPICFLGYASAQYINCESPLYLVEVRIVRLFAIILVSFALLSRMGYETSTMGRVTLLEKTNDETYKFFYLIGLYVSVLSLFLEPISY